MTTVMPSHRLSSHRSVIRCSVSHKVNVQKTGYIDLQSDAVQIIQIKLQIHIIFVEK